MAIGENLPSDNLKNDARVVSIDELLAYELYIPEYQRPYKWGKKNVDELLGDLERALKDAKETKDYSYRIGSIILHRTTKDGEEVFEVVDGQQRIITLLLIKSLLDKSDFKCPLRQRECATFGNLETQSHMQENRHHIDKWLDKYRGDSVSGISIERLDKAFAIIFKVVVLITDNSDEAFQLFDSQNSRGKKPYPQDLLKAHHIRAMEGSRPEGYEEEAWNDEMGEKIEHWEEHDPAEIHDLFEKRLFPITQWMSKRQSHTFGNDDIDLFKGIGKEPEYFYAERARLIADSFEDGKYHTTGSRYQIGEPFMAGIDFFEMVDHYMQMNKEIEGRLENLQGIWSRRDPVNWIKLTRRHTTGLEYVRQIFLCALLCYCDRFGKGDNPCSHLSRLAFKNLFTWAYAVRLDKNALRWSTVNKYATGERVDGCSNVVPMFYEIRRARLHSEIEDMLIDYKKDGYPSGGSKPRQKEQDNLYEFLGEF